MTPLLEVTAVNKSFGAVRSLVDVTFTIEGNGIVGLIGPNGAWKSTLIDVDRRLRAELRTVRFAGRDIARLATARRARNGLVRTFQRPNPIHDLTCVEGVMVGGLAHGMSRPDARHAAEAMLASLGLAAIAAELPRKLPTGHSKLLDLARRRCSCPSWCFSTS